MQTLGIEHMTVDEVREEIDHGGRFVVFEYCISIVVLSFKRGSRVHFVRPGESAFLKGLPYTLTSLLLGWWGFPWQ